MAKRKAEMFMVTLIFLIGLIFTVQQSLREYSALDLSEPFQPNDYYLSNNMKDVFAVLMKSAPDCYTAERNIEEAVAYFNRQLLRKGHIMNIKYNLTCDNWPNLEPAEAPLILTINVQMEKRESTAVLFVYHNTIILPCADQGGVCCLSGQACAGQYVESTDCGRQCCVGREIVPDANTVLLFHLNRQAEFWETNTHVFDFSGNGNNGTVHGSAVWLPGEMFNGAYQFDGEDNYIEVKNDPSLNPADAITISAWVKLNDNNDLGAVIKKSNSTQKNGYTIEGRGSDHHNKLRFGIYNGACPRDDDLGIPEGWCFTESTPELENGKWYHIIGTYNGSALRLYLNGIRVSEVAVSGEIIASENNLTIGKDPSNPEKEERFFRGIIEEVAVWNRSLTPEEIMSLSKRDVMCYAPPEACSCTSWEDKRCGGGGCTRNQMYQTRKCSPSGCAAESQCNLAHPACTGPPVRFDSCMELNKINTKYKLTNDILNINKPAGSACINITANYVTLDCDGFRINDDGFNGIGVYSNSTFTKIKNCNIDVGPAFGGLGIKLRNANNSYIYNTSVSNQYSGIIIQYSHNMTIDKIKANSNAWNGLYISQANNTNLTNIVAKSNVFSGVSFYLSKNINLTNITANGNRGVGITFSKTQDVNIKNVVANDCNPSIFCEGIYGAWTTNLNLTNITANNNKKGILFLRVQGTLQNITTNLNSEEGIQATIAEINLTNLTANSNNIGIECDMCSYSKLEDISIWNCTSDDFGCIYLKNSQNNTFLGGKINKSLNHLIHLHGSENNTFRDLKLYNSENHSIYVTRNSINSTFDNLTIYNPDADVSGIYSDSENTTIQNCNITVTMMRYPPGSYGINLFKANNSYIYNNTFTDIFRALYLNSTSETKIENNMFISNNNGIYLFSHSNSNIITNNNLTLGDGHGIRLHSSSNNNITNNNASYNTYGISLYESSDNELKNNIANSNEFTGISLAYSANNIIINNKANSCTAGAGIICRGILLYSGSNNNLIEENEACRNKNEDFFCNVLGIADDPVGNHGSGNVFDTVQRCSDSWPGAIDFSPCP